MQGKAQPDLPAAPRLRRLTAIINAGSGKQDRARLEAISRAIAAHPWADWEIVVPERPALLAQAARKAIGRGADTIVACGGDGTVSAVAAAVAGSGARLGVVPQGTFNFFARGCDIPADIAAAIEVIAAGHSRPAAAGEVNGRLFLNNASLGLYPEILRQREGIYRRWGRSRLAAHWSMLRTMAGFRRPLRLRIEAGGRVLHRRTPLAFVANSAYQLELLGIDTAAMERGRLALMLAPEGSRLGMVGRLLKLGARLAEERRDYELIAADGFTIATGRSAELVARDGEREMLEGPFTFRLRPEALTVFVPQDPA